MWDVALRLGGQMRFAGRSVTGWDMTAALALASALGAPLRAAAEWLPAIEAVMVRQVNRQMQEGDDG